MVGNIKKACPYCQEKITSTQVLKHIFTYHLELTFNEETQAGRLNRLRLKGSSHKPFHLETPDHSEYYCCFGCRTACAKTKSAENHFQKETCRKGHADAVKDMLAKYPTTKPVYGKPEAAAVAVATDLSANVITTTTTTTTVLKGDPELLKHFLKTLQGKARMAVGDKNSLSKKLAKLQKRYNIPQEEIDDISDASGSDEEPDSEDEGKKEDPVSYDKEKSFHLGSWEYWQRYARALGIPAFTTEEINQANLKKALQNPETSKLYYGK